MLDVPFIRGGVCVGDGDGPIKFIKQKQTACLKNRECPSHPYIVYHSSPPPSQSIGSPCQHRIVISIVSTRILSLQIYARPFTRFYWIHLVGQLINFIQKKRYCQLYNFNPIVLSIVQFVGSIKFALNGVVCPVYFFSNNQWNPIILFLIPSVMIWIQLYCHHSICLYLFVCSAYSIHFSFVIITWPFPTYSNALFQLELYQSVFV